jgi:hypothetical protein
MMEQKEYERIKKRLKNRKQKLQDAIHKAVTDREYSHAVVLYQKAKEKLEAHYRLNV